MTDTIPAEAAWQAWYEPEHDIGRYMTTTRHDEMHRAFLAGWEAAAADPTTENEGFRAYKAGAAAERDRLLLAVRHTCACQSCKDAIASLTGDSDGQH